MDFSPTKIVKYSSFLLALYGLVSPTVSVAQQYYDPGLLQRTIDRKPVDFQSAGIRLGSFGLKTGAEIALEHNDNIFYLENEEIGDTLIHVRPWASLNSDWSRHELNLSAYADIGRYDDSTNEDYEDWVLNLDGRIDVKRGSYFNYNATYMPLHEDRSSPDDVRGIAPTQFNYSGFGAGYSHNFNRVTAALDFATVSTNYDDNVDGDGNILDNQDRDRSQDTLGLRLHYELAGRRSLFLAASVNQIDYDQSTDKRGSQRSSVGRDFQAGISWDLTGLLVGDLYLQYFDQDYDDPAFDNIDGWGIGAGLDWTPTHLTSVNFSFRNSAQETTQPGSSGYASSLYSVRLQHELRHKLLANARVSYTVNDYQVNSQPAGALSDSKVFRAGLGLNYLVNRHLHISGGYMYEEQDANEAVFNYKSNRWFIVLGLDF